VPGRALDPGSRRLTAGVMEEEPMDRLVQMVSTFMEGKVLLAGAELGVFDSLRGWGRTSLQVSRALSADPRAMEILLDALVAVGILEKKDGFYRNKPEYEPYLTDGGQDHFVGLLRHRNRMFRSWANLEDRVLGQPMPDGLRERSVLSDPGSNESFIHAMYASGLRNAAALAEYIDLEPVKTLADLGGGPGHYLAEFARRKADLEPYLVDLPLTLKVAQSILRDTNVYGRIRFVEWDFFHTDPPPTLPPFDLVFISAVLHAESPDQNRLLLRRLAPLVVPGGRVVIQENMVNDDRTWPVDGALFAVNMLANTEGGRTYTEKELVGWAEEAGLQRVSSQRLSPRSCLLQLRKNR
jgi:SAM-dependent methyltransferase